MTYFNVFKRKSVVNNILRPLIDVFQQNKGSRRIRKIERFEIRLYRVGKCFRASTFLNNLIKKKTDKNCRPFENLPGDVCRTSDVLNRIIIRAIYIYYVVDESGNGNYSETFLKAVLKYVQIPL